MIDRDHPRLSRQCRLLSRKSLTTAKHLATFYRGLPMSEKLQNEVDANFNAFQRILPELLRRDADRWALMRHGQCVACYDTLRDAHTAGRAQYEDGLFSVQLISASVVDLGWFSHAVH